MLGVRFEAVQVVAGTGCASGAHTLRCATSAGATRSPHSYECGCYAIAATVRPTGYCAKCGQGHAPAAPLHKLTGVGDKELGERSSLPLLSGSTPFLNKRALSSPRHNAAFVGGMAA
jgi:hypothetical protein